MTPRHKQLIFLVVLNLVWAPVNLCISIASKDASPGAIALLRWTIFSISAWILLSFPHVRKLIGCILPNWKDGLKAGLAGFLLAGPSHALYYVALQHTGITETTTFNTVGPFWTTLFAIFILGEKVSWVRGLCIAGGMIGAYFTAIGFALPSLQGQHTTGNLMYMSGVVLEALSFVCCARLLRRSSGSGILAWEMSGAAAALMILPLVMPNVLQFEVKSFTPSLIVSLLYLIYGAGLISWGGWYVTAEKAPVSLMLTTLGIQAPAAAIIGWKFRNEIPTVGIIWGALIIISCLLIAAWDSRKNDPSLAVELPPEFAAEPAAEG